MSAIEVCIFLVGLIGYSLISRKTEGWPLTMPMVFVALGALADGSGLIELAVDGEGVSLLGEVALAVLLFSDAVRIDVMSLRHDLGLPARLLGIGLPLTVLLGTLGVIMLLPDLTIWEAALVAAVLAPTDAALGQAVVENERVPLRIRQGLNVESGLNDGIVLPAVLLFAALASGEDSSAGFWGQFVIRQIGGGLAIGLAIGAGGGWLLTRGVRTGWTEGIFAQLATLGLALLAFAGALAAGANGFLAAFAAGLAFGIVGENAAKLDEYTEDTGRLLSLVTFFVFGNIFVLPAVDALSVRVVLCALGTLTLARMAPVYLATLGSRPRLPTILFLGWFGPRGLASILFGLLLVEEGLANAEQLFAIITWTVVGSVFLHGASASWGADAYGRWASQHDHPVRT